MQKWAFFMMGLMSGIIVLLVMALFSQHEASLAHARQDGTNDGKGLLMVSGGSADNRQDVVWVLHEHDPLPALAKLVSDSEEAKDLRKPKRLSLMMYQCVNGDKSMKLISARDLSYDEELVDFNTEKPRVAEIYADLKKAAERKKN
jgi:hypothetical protein